MKYYCSSPKCRNECGKKEEDRESVWHDPVSFEGILFCYEPFCDDEGNKFYTQSGISEKQMKLIHSKMESGKVTMI